jgi:hypothetical protein
MGLGAEFTGQKDNNQFRKSHFGQGCTTYPLPEGGFIPNKALVLRKARIQQGGLVETRIGNKVMGLCDCRV